jgi:hypothetical protein
MTGKPLIESDRVEGTTVYDPTENNIGSIKRLMIEKISGRVCYAVLALAGKTSGDTRTQIQVTFTTRAARARLPPIKKPV